jgi:hypothetical protein
VGGREDGTIVLAGDVACDIDGVEGLPKGGFVLSPLDFEEGMFLTGEEIGVRGHGAHAFMPAASRSHGYQGRCGDEKGASFTRGIGVKARFTCELK